MAIYQTYTVRKGDTLSGIARAFATTVTDLVALNGISNPGRIGAGAVLKVKRVNDTFRIGEAGDTLAKVAKRAGVTGDAIARANPATPLSADLDHQSIIVPSPAPVSGPAPAPGHLLGQLSAKYEVGGRGCGTVSTGRGDRGGASYGSYQLASKLDQPRLFLRHEGQPWAARFTDTVQGTPAFTTVWKSCAAEQSGPFGAAQHDYIRRTHYEPQCALIQRRLDIVADARSATLRDVVWSTAVQHGPDSTLIVDVVTALQVAQDAPDFEVKLIDAIYLERGRRGPDGRLIHFSRNSADVQEGVAARFRAERADAQTMLAAERAAATLKAAVIDIPPDQKDADDLLSRIATQLSDNDVRELMERYGDDEARADFESGRKVMVALRRATNWKTAELGKYDDPMLIVWRTGATIQVQRLFGTTEPAGAYAFGHSRAAHGSTVDFDKDGRTDMGRLRAGVYHYHPERHDRLGRIFRARDIQITDRDCNQDGFFTPEDLTSGDRVDRTGAGTSMYIHQGGATFTGSAGCQTLRPPDFATMLKTIGNQDTLSYILINER